MGFFSKLKQNLNHGGIKVRVDAPAMVKLTGESFDATVTIKNEGSEAQNIKSVTVSLVEDRFEQDMSGNPTAQSSLPSNDQRAIRNLASVANQEAFTLEPGQEKALTVTLPIKAAEIINEVAGDNAGLKAVASALGKLETVAAAMNQSHFRHYVQATVDVDGISLDPSAQADVQLLKPGQVGAGINLHA